MENEKKIKKIMNKIIKPTKLERIIPQKDNPFTVNNLQEEEYLNRDKKGTNN